MVHDPPSIAGLGHRHARRGGLNCQGYNTVLVGTQLTSTFTSGFLTFEASDNASSPTWYPIEGIDITNGNPVAFLIAANQEANYSPRLIQFNVAGCTNFRIRLSTALGGGGTLGFYRSRIVGECTRSFSRTHSNDVRARFLIKLPY